MATPPENAERRQQIMEAALRVFSSKGFERTTNKDIATAAGGISPGLIYWYFKDKEDLFLSLLRERGAIFQLFERPEHLFALPPREGLTLVANTYMQMVAPAENRALVRLVASEVIRFPQIGDMLYRGAASKLLQTIQHYLEQQVARGVFRPHDSTIAARSFIGMFVTTVVAREIFHQPEALAVSDAEVVKEAVEIFVRGLETTPPISQ